MGASESQIAKGVWKRRHKPRMSLNVGVSDMG